MTRQDRTDVEALRAFNRLYTSRLGLLDASYDASGLTLSEARTLHEVAKRTDPTGADIARALRIDPAQVSRTVKRFTARGLIRSRESPSHGRHQLLELTEEGRMTFAALEAKTRAVISALLDDLPSVRRDRLLSAAAAIMEVFDDQDPVVALRALQPGDLGLVTARQGRLYAQEYGWNRDYEALVARIVADFHQSFDPMRDDAWIAEVDKQMAGSIFLVHGDQPDAAKLRLLYVEPGLRGMGVGQRLISVCIARARALKYQRLELWTNSVLTAARSLYQRAGFQLIGEAPHRSFGHELTGQTWSLDLNR